MIDYIFMFYQFI